MEKTSYEPGTFCWADLQSKDVNGAKKFYSALFGWEMFDMPVGPGMVYTMCRVRGKDVAALSQMMPDMAATGMPSFWSVYVAVESVDATQKVAADAGGKIAMPAMDVMDEGRMGMIQDPTGATLGLWQPRKMKGAAYIGEKGTMAWHELMTRDTAKAKAFYAKVFGWTIRDQDMGPMGTYTLFDQGKDAHVAGMMAMPPNVPAQAPPYWGVYFGVDDCDASANRAKELGGSILVPPTDIPGTGRFATLTDPYGAVVSIFKLVPM